MKQQLEAFIREFFTLGDFTYNTLGIVEKEKNIFTIKIDTDEGDTMIGRHGNVLDHIQHILRLLVRATISPNIKVSLEINDYQQSKDEHLKKFIYSKIEIIEKNGHDIQLPFYNSYQRKKIHSMVGEYGNPAIYTKSIGEGKDRRLYICKKNESLSIDIDGLGI